MEERELIYKSLENVHQEFHLLLDSIPADFWHQPIPGEDWTIQMEVAHIVQAASLIPGGVERVRKGMRGLPLLFLVPVPLRNWVNGHIVIPIIARKYTPDYAARQYDLANQAILACLEATPDEDLFLSGTYGSGYQRTIKGIFQRPEEHFMEHRLVIQRKLQKLSSSSHSRSIS